MAAITVITINANGLNDDAKRDNFFKQLRDHHKADIVCVQETHIVGRRITRVQDQWEKSTGGTSYWNPGPSSRSGGTGILLVNKSIRVKAIQKDSTGRILCLDLNHEGGNFQIMTIYGPNSPGDREFFFDTLQDHAFTTKTMILCGDFTIWLKIHGWIDNLWLTDPTTRKGTS